jgi:hypothetical protein
LKRLIADCERLAGDLDQEVRNEEDRVKIHDPAHSAYSIYARATAARRDNLRISADELRTHLVKAEHALLKLGDAIFRRLNPRTIVTWKRGGQHTAHWARYDLRRSV